MVVTKPTQYTVTGEQADASLPGSRGPRAVTMLLVGGIILAMATGAVFGGPRPDGKKA